MTGPAGQRRAARHMASAASPPPRSCCEASRGCRRVVHRVFVGVALGLVLGGAAGLVVQARVERSLRGYVEAGNESVDALECLGGERVEAHAEGVCDEPCTCRARAVAVLVLLSVGGVVVLDLDASQCSVALPDGGVC